MFREMFLEMQRALLSLRRSNELPVSRHADTLCEPHSNPYGGKDFNDRYPLRHKAASCWSSPITPMLWRYGSATRH